MKKCSTRKEEKPLSDSNYGGNYIKFLETNTHLFGVLSNPFFVDPCRLRFKG